MLNGLIYRLALVFFSVQQVLKGYPRSTSVVDSRIPVTINLLQVLIDVNDAVCSAYEADIFKVSFSVCFFGAFHILELLPKSYFAYNDLFYSDLFLGETYLQFLLKHSKTDQLGKGRLILVYKISDSSVCLPFDTYIFTDSFTV